MGWHPRVEHIFVAIGLGLLAGGVWWYYYSVLRPQTWPRVPAEVVSSRVINPKGPESYSPELVLRYEVNGTKRQPTLLPAWSSGSYDFVRHHVDRYKPGSRLEVAVNPADPDDARYELGDTLMNLFGPAILGVLGLVFAGIGVVSATWKSLDPVVDLSAESGRAFPPTALVEREVDASMASGAKVARRIGMAFAAVGVVLLATGGVLLRSDLETRTNWPIVDATVVASRVVATGSGSGRSRSTMYTHELRVRYEVAGRTYESTTRGAISTSDRADAEHAVAAYEPGAVRQIAVMPGDPNIIRLETEAGVDFVGSAILLLLGVIFAAVGFAVWKFVRPLPARPIEQVWAEDDEADRFRPRV
jgi:hypothetical protein